MKKLLVALSFLIFSQTASAQNEMREFLVSSGWGMAIGAAVGLGSLAFSEEPSKNLNNVARGASLGLYAGIGLGLASLYREPSVKESDLGSRFLIIPLVAEDKLQGLQTLVSIETF